MERWERTVEMIRACARHQGGSRMLVDEVNRTEAYTEGNERLLTPSDTGVDGVVPITHWDHSDWA